MTNCPKTGTRGKKVDNATIKSMMCESLRQILDESYYFCDIEDCDIVYFSESGSHIIKADSIREAVYQKSPQNPQTKVCYCFQHTVGDIQDAVTNATHDRIVEDIQLGIQQGQCACDWRNPQGSCCLGNVRQFIKQIQIKAV